MPTSVKTKGGANAYAMLTARVPKGMKERGDALLRSMGSTPTKLVNAAYAFLLEHGKLPGAEESQALAPGPRTLNSQQAQRLGQIMEALAMDGERLPDKPYAQLKEEAMRERFPEYFDMEVGRS